MRPRGASAEFHFLSIAVQQTLVGGRPDQSGEHDGDKVGEARIFRVVWCASLPLDGFTCVREKEQG